MRSVVSVLFFLLAFSSPLYAQNNICSGPDPTDNVMNPKELGLVLSEHNALNPNNQPIVSNYTLNVLQGTTQISTASIAKTAMSLQPGTPANCYKFTLPPFSGVNNNSLYKLGVIVNGPAGSSSIGVSTQSFFLQGVPAAPASLRLTVLNMLSRMLDKILSTTVSKPWFKPIGR